MPGVVKIFARASLKCRSIVAQISLKPRSNLAQTSLAQSLRSLSRFLKNLAQPLARSALAQTSLAHRSLKFKKFWPNLEPWSLDFQWITDEFPRAKAPSKRLSQNTSSSQPADSVFFLKTYKTGSSTLATIFSRYCYTHNKSMLLTSQNKGSHLFPHGEADLAEPLNPDGLGIIGWQKKSKQYDFVANHMTYNFTFADEYLPTSKKISILRHPSTHMTSTWKYYFKPNMSDKQIRFFFPSLFKKEKKREERVSFLYELLSDPVDFYKKSMLLQDPSMWKRHFLRPQLWSFFGPEVAAMNLDRDVVKAYIEKIHGHFDLILIMEYFDLGLALLSFELNWPPSELAYLPMNSGRKHSQEAKEYHEELVRVINYPDFMLYEHFNRTFWARIDEIGLDIVQQRADEIKYQSEQLEDACQAGFRPFRNWAGDWIVLPKLKKTKENDIFCRLSTMQGNELSRFMVERQNRLVSGWT